MGNSKENQYEFRFAIVEFQTESQQEDELLPIDLVPGSWIKKSKGKYFCKYPGKKDFEYVEKWTRDEKSPEQRWKMYPVIPIHSAGDFAQGKRRLQRAYETRDCASTDCERQKTLDTPDMMSESNVSQFLHTKLPMDMGLNTGQTRNTESLSQNQVRSKNDDVEENPSGNLYKKRGTFATSKSRNRNNENDTSSDTDASETSSRPLKRNEIKKSSTETDNRPSKNHYRSYALNDSIEDNDNDSLPEESDAKKKKIRRKLCHPAIEKIVHSSLMKFQELEISVHRKIKCSKDSILYNVDHKFDELKAIFASDNTRVPKATVRDLFEAVKTPLPITTIDTFLEFDQAVHEDPEKKDALIALFKYLCFEHSTSQKCIENVLPKIFTKTVQGKYSGQGKKSKGIGKLNFSITSTYACFEAAISATFGESDECKALKSKIGIWLTHFADREGGRKLRGDNQV